jgi:hypothetical protein
MQSESTSQLFELVKVLTNWRFGPQPLWLGHTQRWADLDLNQLGSTCHRFDSTSSAIGLERKGRRVLDCDPISGGALHEKIRQVVELGIDGPRSRSLTARKLQATPERLARARYLANGVTGCIHGHSEHDWKALGGPSIEAKLGAGQVFPEGDLPGVVIAPKLAPDPETGAGTWSDD